MSLILTNVLHAKYNDISEVSGDYNIINFDNSDIDMSSIDKKDLKKINDIRKQLIDDSDYVHIKNNRRTLSNVEILNELNVSANFLNDPTFKKEIARQQKQKSVILKNISNTRKQSVIKHINHALQKDEGISNYILYLAMNESTFNQYARSNASAKGVWQFMTKTARSYNLKVNNYIDEREDVKKSTSAAIRYLKDMNRFFKSWMLSIMAYNTGPGNVIRSYVYNGILNHCEDLGYSCNDDKTVKKHSQILLNYDLYRGKSNFKKLENTFKYYQKSSYAPTLDQMLEMKKKKKQYLPKETRNYIRRILACSIVYNESLLKIGNSQAPSTNTSFKIHIVKPGESLSVIASKHNTTYQKIMRDNGLPNSNININQKLKIY